MTKYLSLLPNPGSQALSSAFLSWFPILRPILSPVGFFSQGLCHQGLPFIGFRKPFPCCQCWLPYHQRHNQQRPYLRQSSGCKTVFCLSRIFHMPSHRLETYAGNRQPHTPPGQFPCKVAHPWVPQREDCLTANIWTGANQSTTFAW